MASEKEANIARDKFSVELKELGAHAISVDEVERNGKKTFAVVAFFEKKANADKRDSLELSVGKKKLNVPLVIRIEEQFKIE